MKRPSQRGRRRSRALAMATGGEGSCNRTRGWSVFDGVKSFRPAAIASAPPETLMADIDAAIAALEHARSTDLLRPFTIRRPRSMDAGEVSSSSSFSLAAVGRRMTGNDAAGLADEAYRSACASLAAGKPDSAMRSLRVALASCPPDKASAISKLRSLVAFAASQAQQQQKQQ